MLVYSSLFYYFIVIVAFYLQHAFNHHMFLLVLVSSLIYHSSTKQSKALRIADMVIAHTAFFTSFLDYYNLTKIKIYWPVVFQATVAMFYKLETIFPQHADEFHVMLHFTSTVGVITNMVLLYIYGFQINTPHL